MVCVLKSFHSLPPIRREAKNKYGRVASLESLLIHLKPTAHRKTKIAYNFGLSECNRVNACCVSKSKQF